MRKIFDEELDALYQRVVEMGKDVSQAIELAVKSFIDHDKELAQQVIDGDAAINAQEIKIEKECFTIIALQQPVASDLRRVVAMMKAANDLERIGDHAVSIAQGTIRVKGNKRILEIEDMLSQMATLVQDMMQDGWRAYINIDIEGARRVAAVDERVDAYLQEVLAAATAGMTNHPETVYGGMSYVLVAGYLERIGDYITNICERVVYLVTGKIEELN